MLSRVGDKNLRDGTTKCMNRYVSAGLFRCMYKMLTGILSDRLMRNGVMAKYNMYGGGKCDKLPFKATKLCHVIKCKKLRLI